MATPTETEKEVALDNEKTTAISPSISDTEAHHEVPSTLIDPRAERSLVWKFDIRILPVLALMYLFNSLDKSNLGNAKTAGLENDLGMAGTSEYNTILSIFFIPYVLTAPFLGILGKKYGPNRVLPCMMFCFGLCTLCVTAVKGFGGLMAIRWFLGMSESAFFPLVIYYQTTWVFFSFFPFFHSRFIIVNDLFWLMGRADFIDVGSSLAVLLFSMLRNL
jgi:MFS family permease